MGFHFTLTLPLYIHEAFWFIHSYGVHDDEKYEAFASRWGSLDLPTFQRVLQEGTGEECAIAIAALGSTRDATLLETLVPFLTSPVRIERWASATWLGRTSDPRAYPILETLLLDGISLLERIQDEQVQREHDGTISWCSMKRAEVISLLGSWSSPSLVQTLHQTYQAQWELEKAGYFYYYDWSIYDILAHVLGQHGDFSIVQTLQLPPPHAKLAMLYLALGYVHYDISQYFALTNGLDNDTELQTRLRTILEHYFHLSVEQQQECIQEWYQNGTDRQNCSRTYYSRKDTNVETEDAEVETDDTGEEQEDDENEDENIDIVVPPIISLYQAHSQPVYSVAWSPDRSALVSASGDATVHVWDTQTGTTRLTFKEHTASVNAVSWSPDGKWIASGGSDNRIFVWDAQTGIPIQMYNKHTGWICRGLAWSPDGTRLASASWDGSVHIWDPLTGETSLIYKGHHSIVYSLAWSPDGTTIASGSGIPECLIHVWNAQTGNRLSTYDGHTAAVMKERIVSEETDDEYAQWLRGPSSVHFLSWSADGRYLASSGLRFACRIWDVLTGQTVAQLDSTDGPLAWSPDPSSHRLALPSPNDGVDIWQKQTNKVIANYDAEEKTITEIDALSWSPDGIRMAVSTKNVVLIWNIE